MAIDRVPAYGEDGEASSMAKGAGRKPAAKAPAPPPDDVALPAAGTTETDLAANLAEAAKRKAAKTKS